MRFASRRDPNANTSRNQSSRQPVIRTFVVPAAPATHQTTHYPPTDQFIQIPIMSDVLFVITSVGFFVGMFLFVWACEKV